MQALTPEKRHRGLRNFAAAVLLVHLALAVISLHGCSGPEETPSADAGTEEALDADVTPEDRPFFDAARPFAEAIAARDYPKAYDLLSSHARLRMSPSQFVAPADDATQERNEASALDHPGPEQFAQLLEATENEYGQPAQLETLYVYSTDPVALGGKARSAEEKLDAMFAIGMMPDSVPADIRKASLRSKLAVELTPEQLAETAEAFEMTPEELKEDPDFQPYLTLKMVLVEESGTLKVGYFEFLPPGILD